MSSISGTGRAGPGAEEADVIRAFLAMLEAEENRIRTGPQSYRNGLLLRIALNELDWHQFPLARVEELSDDVTHKAYIVDTELARIVGHMLSLHEDFTLPTITMRRHDLLVERVRDIGAQLGFIEQGRRVVELAWAGLARVSRPEPFAFDFELPPKLSDAEANERDVVEHYRSKHLKRFEHEVSAGAAARGLTGLIAELLREKVYVWRDHFMGYDADPILDDYFLSLAWTAISDTPQYDAFNERKTFGGIPFLKYLLASAWLVSLCLKHQAFCEAMVEQQPAIQLENILTISADRAEFIDTMRYGLDLIGARFETYTATTPEEAEQIFEVVALTRKNVALVGKPLPPLPVIVESSATAIVKFLSGRHRQMEFMLDSLKANFARDFSLNQQTREASMQRAMEAFFERHFSTAIVRRNVRLRLHGRELTDVDFAVIDPIFGDILLFQLKYQDAHGADFKARNSRMTRFVDESVRWLKAVETWLDSSGPETVRNAFRLPKGTVAKRIRKIIVARHHAYPLAGVQLDEATAFASWIQLYNAGEYMRAKQGDFRTLNGLFGTLRTHIVGAAARFHEDLEPVEYRLFSTSYRIRQSEADTRAGPVNVDRAGR